jgi:hypothetical protein
MEFSSRDESNLLEKKLRREIAECRALFQRGRNGERR